MWTVKFKKHAITLQLTILLRNPRGPSKQPEKDSISVHFAKCQPLMVGDGKIMSQINKQYRFNYHFMIIDIFRPLLNLYTEHPRT